MNFAWLSIVTLVSLPILAHARLPPVDVSAETEPVRNESPLATRHQYIDISAMEETLPARIASKRQLDELTLKFIDEGSTPRLWAALRAHYDSAPFVEERELAPVRHMIHLGQRLKRDGELSRTASIAESLRSHLEEKLTSSPRTQRGVKVPGDDRAQSLEALATVYEKLLDRSVEAELLYYEAYVEDPTCRSAIRGLRRVRGGAQESVDLTESTIDRRRSGKPVDPRLHGILGAPRDE